MRIKAYQENVDGFAEMLYFIYDSRLSKKENDLAFIKWYTNEREKRAPLLTPVTPTPHDIPVNP